jgi:hypothetical protein
MRRSLICVAVAVTVFGMSGLAAAQYYPPYTVPSPPSYYYPVQPGGFVTGNPSPYTPYTPYNPGYYDPNRPVAGTASGSMYWDPYRGWVTNTAQTNVLNSAYSPGRGPMPGTSIQNYNYWNGAQWVQGQRWLGADGQWHGVNTDTAPNPSGGTSSNTTIYSLQPSSRGPAMNNTKPAPR